MKTIAELKALRDVVIAGVGITRWDIYPDQEWYDFGSEAVLRALKDAGLEYKDVQIAFAGSSYQGVSSGHQTLAEIGKTAIPVINVENACSSSSSALRLAYQMVATELYDVALAVGFEKQRYKGFIPSTAWRPWERMLGYNVMPASYAKETVRYMEEYGATIEDISMVTVKNRKNAMLNPNARFQQQVSLAEVMGSRLVSSPLRLLHCSPLADGAVAAIVCSKDKIQSKKKAVTIAAATLTSGMYGEGNCGRNSVKYPADPNYVEISARQAYEVAGYGPEDMDVIQVYDAMSPAELWDIEQLGFCKPGEAHHMLRDGYFDLDGKLPSNTDGGLMGRGHPMGATALGQIYEIVMQLRGEAGKRQVPKAKIGLAHSLGAGPNSSVTILKK
ncbi:MAG: thiolase family protein [Dehalococcoidales bacterium]|nr:thiolase family protein [Dehalococcoidales bacterium]